MAKPLHPKVGSQIFVLDGVKPSPKCPTVISFDRKALEKIWQMLHELNDVSEELEKESESKRTD